MKPFLLTLFGVLVLAIGVAPDTNGTGFILCAFAGASLLLLAEVCRK